jgi:hypothetical protein
MARTGGPACAPGWTTGRQACQIIGCTSHRLLSLAASGQIRTQALPGISMKYRIEDAEQIAAEAASAQKKGA